MARKGKMKKGWIEILPRFKIQYPMKNRDKDANHNLKIKTFKELFFILLY